MSRDWLNIRFGCMHLHAGDNGRWWRFHWTYNNFWHGEPWWRVSVYTLRWPWSV